MIDPISHSTLFSASLLFPLLRASQFSRKHTHTDKEKERKKNESPWKQRHSRSIRRVVCCFVIWRNGLDWGPPFLACLVSPFSFFPLVFFWFFLALSCVWEATLRCLPSALSPNWAKGEAAQAKLWAHDENEERKKKKSRIPAHLLNGILDLVLSLLLMKTLRALTRAHNWSASLFSSLFLSLDMPELRVLASSEKVIPSFLLILCELSIINPQNFRSSTKSQWTFNRLKFSISWRDSINENWFVKLYSPFLSL